MDAPIGTNMKLWSILCSLTRELERINTEAWGLSKDPKDTCGAIGIALPDYNEPTLIKEIEMRATQIEKRKRYIAGIQHGDAAYTLACEQRADELYQKYCGKR
ncbi:hypothetical protein MPK71_gp031 [Erwinia phage pEa_SNUABM_1]|uniref:Uncharacterized protein n=1 Tax=Erwinia phage pEa_SNUABM_1 TaxID=2869543 RepID=A0AAE7XKJ8_9CAUD|nr:hypothetical protein MPK71_gp031 [Erwinia phage pEa_SNUABM_1]QZE57240.1 hypothetical protein pEaSNUABM1_00031 [Erwinia phage pEa_SNUABM_1]